jgi:hypothetical protein
MVVVSGALGCKVLVFLWEYMCRSSSEIGYLRREEELLDVLLMKYDKMYEAA